MAADANWPRWIVASVNKHLKAQASSLSVVALMEGVDHRDSTFMEASDRLEFRLQGPFVKELSKNYFELLVDINVLITSRYDGPNKNAYTLLTLCGAFQKTLQQIISVFRYGGGAEDDDTLVGCLVPRQEKRHSVDTYHFGQIHKTDRERQSVVDASYEMYLTL